MAKIFVYGTLMKGFGLNSALDEEEFLGEISTLPEYTLHDLGAYPALSSGGSTAVKGELYEVTEECRARLDRIEGHPSFYRRQEVKLDDPSGILEGDPVEAYFIDNCSAPVISSGSFRARRARNGRESRL